MARSWASVGARCHLPVVAGKRVVIPSVETINDRLFGGVGIGFDTGCGGCRQGRQTHVSARLREAAGLGAVVSPARTAPIRYRNKVGQFAAKGLSVENTMNAWTGEPHEFMGTNRDRTINGFGFVQLEASHSIVYAEGPYGRRGGPPYKAALKMRDDPEFRIALTQLLDMTLGQLGVLLAPAGEKKRARRFQPAGAYAMLGEAHYEYRTMSNWWLQNTMFTFLALGYARDLYASLAANQHTMLLKAAPSAEDVVSAINKADKKLAKKNWDRVKRTIPQHSQEEVGTLNSVAFIDYLIENGLGILTNGSAPEFRELSWEGTIASLRKQNNELNTFINNF